MMWDCRTDDYYNQKYLKKDDANFINGFDYAVSAFENILYNLIDDVCEGDIFDLTDDYGFNVGLYLEKHEDIVKKIKEAVNFLFESDRDTAITSFIDCYENFDERKADIDSGKMEGEYIPLYEEKSNDD